MQKQFLHVLSWSHALIQSREPVFSAPFSPRSFVTYRPGERCGMVSPRSKPKATQPNPTQEKFSQNSRDGAWSVSLEPWKLEKERKERTPHATPPIRCTIIRVPIVIAISRHKLSGGVLYEEHIERNIDSSLLEISDLSDYRIATAQYGGTCASLHIKTSVSLVGSRRPSTQRVRKGLHDETGVLSVEQCHFFFATAV
jgi:hypothetical protein